MDASACCILDRQRFDAALLAEPHNAAPTKSAVRLALQGNCSNFRIDQSAAAVTAA